MLQLQAISKTFNPGTVTEKKALNQLSLDLPDGDFVTVVGSNGAGKSTMFNAIAGAFFVDEGRVILDGEDSFVFACDDEVMHRRGGTYRFYALDIDTFRREICRWVSEGKAIAKRCGTTEELQEWYLANWSFYERE